MKSSTMLGEELECDVLKVLNIYLITGTVLVFMAGIP